MVYKKVVSAPTTTTPVFFFFLSFVEWSKISSNFSLFVPPKSSACRSSFSTNMKFSTQKSLKFFFIKSTQILFSYMGWEEYKKLTAGKVKLFEKECWKLRGDIIHWGQPLHSSTPRAIERSSPLLLYILLSLFSNEFPIPIFSLSSFHLEEKSTTQIRLATHHNQLHHQQHLLLLLLSLSSKVSLQTLNRASLPSWKRIS